MRNVFEKAEIKDILQIILKYYYHLSRITLPFNSRGKNKRSLYFFHAMHVLNYLQSSFE